MILAIDIGNSNVVFGLHDNGTWIKIWRIHTLKDQSVYHYQMKLSQSFLENDLNSNDVSEIVLSSVVPDLTEKFIDFLQFFNNGRLLILDHSIYPKLKVQTINPYEMGTDLMANAIAAHELNDQNKIIVDFGTALTFTLLKNNGEISGVNIFPGIKTSINALSSNAAQLHTVPLEYPDYVLGKNTIEAIQNGVLIGYTGLVQHMLQEIQRKTNTKCYTIATGGLSEVLKELEFDLVDKNLTLNGLRWVAQNC